MVTEYAIENNEPIIDGLEIVRPWHADGSEYFRCDDNGVVRGDWKDWQFARLPDGTRTIELSFNEIVIDEPANIIFMMNDHLDEIEKSPKTAVRMLGRPFRSLEHFFENRWTHFVPFPGEPGLRNRSIEVFKANKPGEVRYYQMGGNCVKAAELIKQRKNGRTVLKLYTSDEDKREYLIIQKLKKLKREKRLEEVSKISGHLIKDLRRMASRSRLDWSDHKKLEPILEKF